jgi:hypothetical protein
MSMLEPIPMGIAYSAATCRAQGSTLVASASSTGIAVQEGPCRFHSWSGSSSPWSTINQMGSSFDLILIEFEADVAIEVRRHFWSPVSQFKNSSNSPNSEATSAIASNNRAVCFKHIGNQSNRQANRANRRIVAQPKSSRQIAVSLNW